MRYAILIQYDEVDDIYVASVPELQGCMAHGRTQEEALKEIGIVIEMWIEEARSSGLQLPKPSYYVHAS